MSETTKRKVTRCYINPDGVFILRTLGQTDVVVQMPNVSSNVHDAMIGEMVARLLLAGVSAGDIAAGVGIPDRALPADRAAKEKGPRPLNMIRRAILAVRVSDLKKSARTDGKKLDGQTIATLTDDAMVWVRGLTDDQAARMEKNVVVMVELARLRGTSATLDELSGEPAPASEPEPAAEAAD